MEVIFVCLARGRGWCQFSPQLLGRAPKGLPGRRGYSQNPCLSVKCRSPFHQKHSDLSANFP